MVSHSLEGPMDNYALCLFCTQVFSVGEMRPILLQGKKMLICEACSQQMERGSIVKPDLTVLNMYTMLAMTGGGMQEQMQTMFTQMQQATRQMSRDPLFMHAVMLTAAALEGGQVQPNVAMQLFDFFITELGNRMQKFIG
jgi:hypothetical protein